MEQLSAWASNIVERGWEHTEQFTLGSVNMFAKFLKAVGYDVGQGLVLSCNKARYVLCSPHGKSQ
jgi:hypothetical protein